MLGLDRKDLKYLLILCALTFCLNIIGLGKLEYFRHTEADRTLIAWEMQESGDYFTPKLTHSTILTKPPLYYWTLALSFKVFGAVSEFTARFPSVIISVFFVLMQYLFWRKCKNDYYTSFFASIALATGMFFFLQSTVAEIDILFGFLCTMAFYFSFFAIKNKSLKNTLLTYFISALAFLTKGMPIVFFFVAIHFSFFFIELFRNKEKNKLNVLINFIIQNLLGTFVFIAVVSPWLYFISKKFGLDELIRQYNIEVAQRFIEEKNNPRGIFYYPGMLIGELAPWTLIYLSVFGYWVYNLIRKRKIFNTLDPKKIDFILFNTLAVFLAFIMLSIAKGKSARYIFPVYACCINLLPFFIAELRNTYLERKLFLLGKWLSLAFCLAITIAIFFVKVPAVSRESMIISGLALVLALVAIYLSCKAENSIKLLIGTILLFFAIKIGLVNIFYSYRNNEMSVKWIAREINETLPKGAVLYDIEFFDRWITYYLKQLGRETWRLTPEESLNPKDFNGRTYLIFKQIEEGWRFEQLKEIDPSTKLLKSFQEKKYLYLLVETDKNSLKFMKPHTHFPTVPSEPFYNVTNKELL